MKTTNLHLLLELETKTIIEMWPYRPTLEQIKIVWGERPEKTAVFACAIYECDPGFLEGRVVELKKFRKFKEGT